ncbi:MAG: hypothetical protein VYC34_05480 [Planctomycetota bacterium]|nr:hypothetical protein [Planctomycetota bacterium]
MSQVDHPSIVNESPLRPPSPWDDAAARLSGWLGSFVPHDAFALWVLNPVRPKPDELLAQQGFWAQALVDWASGGWQRDELLGQVAGGGAATGLLKEAAIDDSGLAGASVL